MPAWSILLTALVYLCALFAIAHAADTSGGRLMNGRARATIYALALAVYCTSWTFYGSVGFASRAGLDFLAIYVGPILVIGFGHGFVARVVRIAKAQNITSIADFVGARYGKSELVAALVCIVAVIGALPYIALQLKAVSTSLEAMLVATGAPVPAGGWPLLGDLAFFVALVLAAFAIAFGTRHIDATEHQDGLVLAIAAESIIKLVAFLAIGLFVVYGLFDGFGDAIARAQRPPSPQPAIWERNSGPATFVTVTLLSAFAAVLLPRQFHMAIVENRDVRDVRRVAWMFPLYLVAINLFVLPIAIAGEVLLSGGAVDRDMTVLLLPLQANQPMLALLVFIGGLSAATAMVIVASVALAIMISNHLVLPLLVRGRARSSVWPGERRNDPIENPTPSTPLPGADIGGQIIVIRRFAIAVVILLGYAYYRAAGDAALAAIGLLSFAAVAQIGPAFFGGLVWRRGTAPGAAAGLAIGLVVWFYTLLLPNFARSDGVFTEVVANGPWGVGWLRPEALFGLDLAPLPHGVLWSLSLNFLAYVLISRLRPTNAMERLQAGLFVTSEGAPMTQTLRLWRASVTMSELQATVARYLGAERTKRAFEGFLVSRGETQTPTREADIHMLRFAEHLIASAIGAASSRLVLSLLLKRRNLSTEAAFKLLDDASAALQYNRDVLQHALDHTDQGVTVLDRDLRLIAWNHAFLDLYELPQTLVRVGIGLDDIIRFNATRGAYGPGPVEELVAARIENFVHAREPVRLTVHPSGRVIEIRTNLLPDGGLVTTYADVTDVVLAERQLASANETLERRVVERTEELTVVNEALKRAKAEAEEANISKTRFLAAASHDILQPLNAARLYASSLVERDKGEGRPVLAENVDAALEAVEDILTALLDISRLDSGALKPDIGNVNLGELLRQLQREFEPVAREKGLSLRFVGTSATARTDRKLLRRLLQNLISNAIKYTPSGRVLVGVRRRREKVVLQVLDTGLGIPAQKQKLVFREFQRLDEGAKVARGLGLGLSIVQRIAKSLKHNLELASEPGRGTVFSLEVPLGVGAAVTAGAGPAEPSPAAPLAGLRLLVVDNEPAIIDGMRTLLGGWGCRIETAGGLAEALASLEAAQPDAILADFHLDNEENGLSLIEAVRTKLGAAVPAVLLTADRTPEVRERAAAADVHVLNKPLKPAALRALLAQWRVTRMAAE